MGGRKHNLRDIRRTPSTAAAPAWVRKAFRAGGATATGVLTYPGRDQQGDTVNPTGGDWSAWHLHPRVDLEHDITVGRGAVELCDLTGGPDGPVRVPVATTTFAQRPADLAGLDRTIRDPKTLAPVGLYSVDDCLEAAEQAAALVGSGAMTGLSMEFYPVGPPQKTATGNHYERWTPAAYTHAADPVNDMARLLAAGGPEAARIEKCHRAAWSGRLPGGQVLCGPVMKALSRYARIPRPATVVGGYAPRRKAMEDQMTDELPPADAADSPAPEADAGDEPPTSVAANYMLAQGMLDLCEQYRQMMARSDNPQARKDAERACDEVEKAAAKYKAAGDKLAAKLDVDAGAEADDSDDADDREEGEQADDRSDDAPPEVETDDDGAMVVKAFPRWKPYRVVKAFRFSPSQVRPVAAPVAKADPAAQKRYLKLLREEEQEAKRKALLTGKAR